MRSLWSLPLAMVLAACGTGPDDDTQPTDTDPIVETDPTDTGAVETDTDPTETDTGKTETDTDPVETDTDPVETDTDPVETDTDPVETDTDPVETDTDTDLPIDTGVTVLPTDTGDTGTPVLPTDTAPPAPICQYELRFFPWGSTGEAADFYLYDGSGNLILEEDFAPGATENHVVTLPSGHYYRVIRKPGENLRGNVALYTEPAGLFTAALSQTTPGYDVKWFDISCADDGGLTDTGWTQPDEAPVLPPIWEDDGTHGTCAYALQLVSDFDHWSQPGEAGFVLYDDELNVLASRAPGLWKSGEMAQEILELTDGRYLVDMSDLGGDGWHGGHLRLVDGDGTIVETITLEDGDAGYHYLTVDCAEDTGPFEGWDTDPDVTDIDTGWYLGAEYRGCPVTIAVNTANAQNDMAFEILDASGAVVYDDLDAWPIGIVSSADVQYAYTALPAGDYTLRLQDKGTLGTGWGTWPFVRVHDAADGTYLGGGGHHSKGEFVDYAISVDCGGDTGSWYAGDVEDLTDDTGWSMGVDWYDTDLPESCGFMVEVAAPQDPTGGAWEIHDQDGRQLFLTQPGDMELPFGLYRTPVELPSGLYRMRMIDELGRGFSNWQAPENFRILDASGEVIHAFSMASSATKTDEWFLLDCADDTDTPVYPEGWCPPVLEDTAVGMVDDCAAALHIRAGYSASDMGVVLYDSQGVEIASVSEGELTQQGDHFVPLGRLPSDGYHAVLTSASGNAWSSSAFVQLVAADGRCVDEGEPLSEAWTLTTDNGFGGHRDVWFTHDCAADSGSFGWDTGWCEPVLDTAEQGSGACSYAVKVQAGSDYASMAAELTDVDGNVVWTLNAGDLGGKGVYWFPVNLPTGHYGLTREATGYTKYWATGSQVQIVPTSGACVDEAGATEVYTLVSGWNGIQTDWLSIECGDDTAGFLDTGFCAPVLDASESVDGACGMVALIYAGYDYVNMGVTLTDSLGNEVLRVDPGDLTFQGHHYVPFEAPTEGYELHMWTNNPSNRNWSTGYVQLMSASGQCIDESTASETFTVTAYGENTEFLSIDCEEDTAGAFTWPVDWCPEVLESTEVPTGDCGFVLEVKTGFDAYDMAITVTDEAGAEVLKIAANDGQLQRNRIHYFPLSLSAQTYDLKLEDASQYSTTWDANGKVRLVPNDGACLLEDGATEAWSVTANSLNEVSFEVTCGVVDTALDTAP